MHGVSNKRFASRRTRPPVFLDAHQQKRSCSVATQNEALGDYVEIPAGTVLARCQDNLHRPCAADTAQEAVDAANVIEVSDAYQFRVGDVVELPEAVLPGADRFRTITAIDFDTNEITLGGAAFSLDAGAAIEVDPSRVFAEVKTTAGAPGTATTAIAVLNGGAAKFAVGDVLEVGAASQQIVTTTLTYDAGIEAIVEVAVYDRATGELVASVEVEHAMATDAATSVAAIAAKLEDELPANTAAATSSGDDLIVTTENTQYRIELTLGFGTGSVDTGAWSAPAYSGRTEGLTVTAVVTTADANTITVDGDIAVTDGELIAGPKRGGYKILTSTLVMDYGHGMSPDNVLGPYRTHGEARIEAVIGLTADARTALEPLVEFKSLHA